MAHLILVLLLAGCSADTAVQRVAPLNEADAGCYVVAGKADGGLGLEHVPFPYPDCGDDDAG